MPLGDVLLLPIGACRAKVELHQSFLVFLIKLHELLIGHCNESTWCIEFYDFIGVNGVLD